MKVKIFRREYIETDDLEKEINDFINKKNIHVIDIETSESMWEDEYNYKVLVLYEEV